MSVFLAAMITGTILMISASAFTITDYTPVKGRISGVMVLLGTVLLLFGVLYGILVVAR